MMRIAAAEGQGSQNLWPLQEDPRVCVSMADKIFVHYRGTLESLSIIAGPLESLSIGGIIAESVSTTGGPLESLSIIRGLQSLCPLQGDLKVSVPTAETARHQLCHTGVGIARPGQLLKSHLLPPVLNLPHWGSRGSPGASLTALVLRVGWTL